MLSCKKVRIPRAPSSTREKSNTQTHLPAPQHHPAPAPPLGLGTPPEFSIIDSAFEREFAQQIVRVLGFFFFLRGRDALGDADGGGEGGEEEGEHFWWGLRGMRVWIMGRGVGLQGSMEGCWWGGDDVRAS